MAHANARLTEFGRLLLVLRVRRRHRQGPHRLAWRPWPRPPT
jgi:hypothetical protein